MLEAKSKVASVTESIEAMTEALKESTNAALLNPDLFNQNYEAASKQYREAKELYEAYSSFSGSTGTAKWGVAGAEGERNVLTYQTDDRTNSMNSEIITTIRDTLKQYGFDV